MVIFAMPAVMLDSGFLCLDRLIGTQFFNQSEGGDTLFYQHMFWFLGPPEVYIIFIPGLGFLSSAKLASRTSGDSTVAYAFAFAQAAEAAMQVKVPSARPISVG